MKAFMETAQSVGIDEDEGKFVITPVQNLGTKNGFEPVSSRAESTSGLELASGLVKKMHSMKGTEQ
jgi:hypothetical protein